MGGRGRGGGEERIRRGQREDMSRRGENKEGVGGGGQGKDNTLITCLLGEGVGGRQKDN